MNMLPETCETNSQAVAFTLTMNRDDSPIFNFVSAKTVTQKFIDELCKQLVIRRVDKVTLLNASDEMNSHFLMSAMLHSAKFSIEYRKSSKSFN